MTINPKWIFFDIGETLLNEQEAVNHRIHQVVSLSCERGYKLTFNEVYEQLIRAHKNYVGSPMKWAIDQLIHHESDRIYIKEKLIYRTDLEYPYPQTKEVLLKLALKYKVGVIANQLAGTVSRLEGHGLMPCISLVLSSTEVGLAKPDIRIFQLALEQAGSSASQAIMVGDRLDNDIRPAKLVGMTTVWIRQGNAKYQNPVDPESQPDYIIQEISELLELI